MTTGHGALKDYVLISGAQQKLPLTRYCEVFNSAGSK